LRKKQAMHFILNFLYLLLKNASFLFLKASPDFIVIILVAVLSLKASQALLSLKVSQATPS